LKTTKKDNPYLFANGNGSHLDSESIGKRIKVLAKKTKLHMPKGKRLRFHCFRKRFLSECANLKIDINTAKILVGKSVSKDMLTYLSEVQHVKAFEEVHNKLRLTEFKAVTNAKNAEIEALKKRIEEQDIMIAGLLRMFKNPEETRVKLEEITTTKAYATYVRDLGENELRRQAEEYKKLIEENNNNNH